VYEKDVGEGNEVKDVGEVDELKEIRRRSYWLEG
jgi:hypothetical protein